MNSILDDIKGCFVKNLSELFQGEEIQNLLEFSYPDKKEFGDLSINLALKLSKKLKKNPRDIATKITENFKNDPLITEFFNDITIAGPGFINFFFSDVLLKKIADKIDSEKEKFGSNLSLKDKKILIEFVSANPTGPLTIAHARQAVVGDSLYRIFKNCGASPHREYYLNDKGVQIITLGKSVFSRYLEILGKNVNFEEDFYQGDYIFELARKFHEEFQDKYAEMDIEKGALEFKEKAYNIILEEIKKDLSDFRVAFENYYSEKSLEENGKIEECLNYLKEKAHVYENEGAFWFKSTAFGDDKDRVLVKSNGEQTYLASDIPYHKDKLERGFNLLINILGPDHHGYIARLKASVEALGFDPKILEVLIVQLTTLYRGTEQLRMSTRKGQYITLRQLIDEVGVDAARYFFARRKTDSHLDFDLELAKKQTPDNPVFYVQYAGARINSIIRKAREKFPDLNLNVDLDIKKCSEADKSLLKILNRFPEIVEDSARLVEPQKVTLYLEEIAGDFQSYYSGGNRVISDDKDLTFQKVKLIGLFRQVVENGLNLLGIEIPERM